MLINEVRFPLIKHPKSKEKLYPHQAALWDAWNLEPNLLLASKTGTGKTRAAMMPILDEGNCALAIYPTNELLGDQVRAVNELAAGEGKKSVIWTPETASPAVYSSADWIMIPVDGKLISSWQFKMSCRSRGETLRRLLNPDKKKIVFTNPDILFLVLGLYYHAEPFEALRAYKTLVVDEFHLYQGVELAHALAMIAIARGFDIFDRTVLLSATPQKDVLELLKTALQVKIVEPSLSAGPCDLERTAVHEVDLQALLRIPGDNIESIQQELLSTKTTLELLRNTNGNDQYIPAVTVVNSVFSAIRLEDQLVASGFDRKQLSIIRGLSNRDVRERRGKLIAVGTSAIEVGVDFDCDQLLFEASDAASFLQRFGRVGRHRHGKAKVWVPPNVFEGMLDQNERIDRGVFEQLVYSWYPQLNSSPWFALTEHGMITARSLAENLFETVEKNGSDSNLLKKLRVRLDEILFQHANRMGCGPQEVQAKKAFERARSGKKSSKWLISYCGLNRFRTSLPSLDVHDFAEQQRRTDWKMGDYEIDLLTLLKRGKNIKWNEKLDKLTISGIGANMNVHASDLPFSDDDCFQIFETRDYPNLAIFQDGIITPISNIFAKGNHVFCLVPSRSVEGRTDWRLPLIKAGKYFLALDGAALLLVELTRRER
ncbi:MAG: type I-D CRISPR-associated helicase Cas3' [Candidatus Obscuribacterales bacterium]|nr:type I-D CRISPR-associated helicase Cas3' [Candidatus Obscuribacterales bacterium]